MELLRLDCYLEFVLGESYSHLRFTSGSSYEVMLLKCRFLKANSFNLHSGNGISLESTL